MATASISTNHSVYAAHNAWQRSLEVQAEEQTGIQARPTYKRTSLPRSESDLSSNDSGSAGTPVPTENAFRNSASPHRDERAVYVPVNTPCYVSCGDGSWHSGFWGDNHRTVSPIDAAAFRTRDAPPVAIQREITEGNSTFIRHADVLLLDNHGRHMFMAANRKRPCLIRFPAETWLYKQDPSGSFRAVPLSEIC